MVTSSSFPVDGQLLMVLPRAGVSINNPDVRLPMLRSDEDGYYLELRVEADPQEPSEVAVARRVRLQDISTAEWEVVKAQYAQLNLQSCADQDLLKRIQEKFPERRIQRLFMTLLTFLNPRQVSIVLYLYRLAAQQNNGSLVSFRSNDLLESLGYKRTKDGGFAAKLRSQLHRDLMALHRTELMMARSLRQGESLGAKVMLKSIIRVQDFEIDHVPRAFDLFKAADYTYELADAYSISLEFFDGPGRTGDTVLLANNFDMTQRLGSASKHDYKTKLLIYLASRLKWDAPEDGQFLVLSKQYLFKNLDLLGSNSSRNNQIFWRTVDELKQSGYLLGAQELLGRKAATIQVQLNPKQLAGKSGESRKN